MGTDITRTLDKSAGSGRRVYRSRTQAFTLVVAILVFDVLIGAGVARNTHRTALVLFGIAMIVLYTAVVGRAAAPAIITSPAGIVGELNALLASRRV